MNAPTANPFSDPPLLRAMPLALCRLLLRWRSATLLAPASLLVIAPHPDDECLGCGGLIARTHAKGARIRILFLTDGEGASGKPDPALGRVRREEARQAASRLGVAAADLHWLGLPDSGLDKLSASKAEILRTTLCDLLQAAPAELVVVTSSHDGSSEHVAAALLCQAALRDLPEAPPLLGYLVWTAWSPTLLWNLLFTKSNVRFLQLESGSLATKREALACHQSQLTPGMLGPDAILPRGFASVLCARQEFFLEEAPGNSPLAKRVPTLQPEDK